MLICLSFLISSLVSEPFWPGKSWPVLLPRDSGFDDQRFEEILDYTFKEPLPGRKGRRTDALVIVKNGALVFERYENGFGPDKKHITWSVSKTLAALLVGVAEKQGWLNRKDLVSQYLPDLVRDDKKNLTIEHLLYWSSSIDWTETYEYLPLFSDVVAMFYTAGFSDMGRYVLGLPQLDQPGERWRYSSGDTTILMRVLQKAVPDYADFPWKFLFDKLDFSNVTFERDGQGVFVGAGFFYSSARDLARLGHLILQRGRWKNDQILPVDWISMMSKPATAYVSKRVFEGGTQEYGGGHIWLNYLGPEISPQLRWKDAPADTMVAMGHWGQYLVIVPSLDLVIVRFGDDRDRRIFGMNEFIHLVVRSLDKK